MHSQVLKEQLTKTRFVGLNFSFMCVKPSLLFIYLIPEADTPQLTPPALATTWGCHTKTRG